MLWAWNGLPLNTFQCTLERTDAVTNEVIEPIKFVLAYPTVCDFELPEDDDEPKRVAAKLDEMHVSENMCIFLVLRDCNYLQVGLL